MLTIVSVLVQPNCDGQNVQMGNAKHEADGAETMDKSQRRIGSGGAFSICNFQALDSVSPFRQAHTTNELALEICVGHFFYYSL